MANKAKCLVPTREMEEIGKNLFDEIVGGKNKGTKGSFEQAKEEWSRTDVENDPTTLYIFTDNIDRSSGSGTIPATSWYAKKYGKGLKYPNQTAAVIRGLENAFPISTQKWYHKDAKTGKWYKGDTGNWQDADVEEFKAVIQDEVAEIKKAWDSGKFTKVVYPKGDGFFNGKISKINEDRVPKINKILEEAVNELQSYIEGNNKATKDKSIIKVITSKEENYPARTKENANWSDITLAFAADFSSAGETLTAQYAGSKDSKYLGRKKALSRAKDKHVPIHLTSKNGKLTNDPKKDAEEIIKIIEEKELPTKNVKLNIAGNGIYTLKGKISQEELNNYITEVLENLANKGVEIQEVRSGGQTGADEAGAIAGSNLGYKTTVVAPANYKMRTIEGKDITDKEVFINRFNTKNAVSKVIETTGKKEKLKTSLYSFTPKTIKDAIEAFTSKKGIVKEDWNKYKEEVIKFLDNYFRVNKEFEVDESSIDEYKEWYDLYSEYFNTPIDDNEYNRAIAQDALDITNGAALMLELNKNKIIIVCPKPVKEGEGNNLYRPNYKVESINSLEAAESKVRDMIKYFQKRVFRDENFKDNHVYWVIDDEGHKQKADLSVTSVDITNDKFVFTPVEKDTPSYVQPWLSFGNTFDAFVRDYFSKKGLKPTAYPNFNQATRSRLVTSLEALKREFDKKFGKDKYKIITEEFPMASWVKDSKGKMRAVAGTTDMIVVTDKGELYIYDMKTSRKGLTKEYLDKYSKQLTFYKRIIEENYPIFKGKVNIGGLLVAETDYLWGDASIKNKYSKEEDSEQIYFGGKKIQETSDFHINFKMVDGTNNSRITNLDLNQSVENLQIDSLTDSDYKALEEMPQPLNYDLREYISDTKKQLQEKKTQEEKDKIFGSSATTLESVNTGGILQLVPTNEKVAVGKNIMQLVSDLIDRLNTDDSYRIELARGDNTKHSKNFFTSMPRNQILQMPGVKNEILYYIRDVYFGKDSYIQEDEGIEDYEYYNSKIKWVHDHFTEVINTAWSELSAIENVGLISGDLQSDDSEIEAYNIDSRELPVLGGYPKIKRLLSKIPLYEYTEVKDENGNIISVPILDKNGRPIPVADEYGYGLPQYMNRNQATQFLLDKIHTLKSFDAMMEKMQELSNEAPWINIIIEKLTPPTNSSVEAVNEVLDLQSQFFTTFRKNKVLYSHITKASKFFKEHGIDYANYNLDELATQNDLNAEVVNTIVQGEAELFDVITINDKGDKSFVGESTLNTSILEDLQDDIDVIKSKKNRKATVNALERVLPALGIKFEDSYRELSKAKNKLSLNRISDNIKYLIKKLEAAGDSSFIPYSYGQQNYNGILRELAKFKLSVSELSIYDSGKTRQAYVSPSFLGDLIESLTLEGQDLNEDDDFDDILRQYIENKYVPYRQFCSGINEDGSPEFVNSILKKLYDDPDKRKLLEWRVQTSSMDKSYAEQDSKLYSLSLLVEFFTPEANIEGKSSNIARFRVPTFSDKPSGEYIQFEKYNISKDEDDFGLDEMKANITEDAKNFFLFEIQRMQSLIEAIRNNDTRVIDYYSIKEEDLPEALLNKIKNGTKNIQTGKTEYEPITFSDIIANGELLKPLAKSGFNFVYIPFLNDELNNQTELGQLILDAINDGDCNTTELLNKFRIAYNEGMERRFSNYKEVLKSKGITRKELLKAIPNATMVDKLKEGEIDLLDAYLQEYFWNDSWGAMNIMNLTIVDPAFNKDIIDIQKRFAEIHSTTDRVNLDARFMDTDKVIRKYSADGMCRVLYVEDDINPSEIANAVREIILKAGTGIDGTIDTNHLDLANSVYHLFNNINMTDGQAYSSPTGFFKKYGMLGLMDDNKREAFDKIRKGDLSINNLLAVFQPFKPFTYSQIEFNSNTSMGDMFIPTQMKDSEYLLTLAGAIMKGANVNSPLAALYDIMEESAYNGKKLKEGKIIKGKNAPYNGKGIDTVVFHSTVKTGAYNVINLSDIINKEKSKDNPNYYQAIKNDIYDKIYDSNGNYNRDWVHTFSFENWGKQQNVPSHFKDHFQPIGSQEKVLSVSDIPEVDSDGNQVYLSVNGVKEPLTTKQFYENYFNLLAKDHNNSINSIKEKLKLNSNNPREIVRILSKEFRDSIVKDAKYSYDMFQAVLPNGKGGFSAPIGDPSISGRLENIMFSMLKNTINKLDMPGGPAVQATCYGLDENLSIVFKDNQGKELLSYKDFLKDYKLKDSAEAITKWNEYLKQNAVGISHYEAYVTAPTEEIERKITNSKGEIMSMQEIIDNGILTPDELKMIGYRIPTEDKYSIFPIKIKGFLPRTGGEVIILPKEVTLIAGLDFDIDKLYCMIKSEGDLNESQKLKNQIFEYQWAALTHESSFEKMFNPGGFDVLKDLANEINPTTNKNTLSMMYADGQIYFHEQNMVGKELVSIMAVNNTAHSICNFAKIGLKVPYFSVNGNHISQYFKEEDGSDYFNIDSSYSVFDGSRISKSLATLLAAAVDNAKDPVLARLNITPVTANLTTFMIRAGIPLRTTALILNQPIIKKLSEKASIEDVSLKSIIYSALSEGGVENISKAVSDYEQGLNSYDFNDEDLWNNINSSNTNVTHLGNQELLLTVLAMLDSSEKLELITDMTKLNSLKNSAGPDIYKALKYKLRIQEFQDECGLGVLGSFDDNTRKLFDTVSYLKPLADVYTNLVPQIFSPYFIQFSPKFTSLLSYLVSTLGLSSKYFSDKFIKNLFNQFLIYNASSITKNINGNNVPLIDMSYEARANLMYVLPLEILKLKSNKDTTNEFIRALEVTPTLTKKLSIPGLKLNTGNLDVSIQNLLTSSWQTMVENADPETSTQTKLLSDKLISYNILRGGFMFGPSLFLNLAPTEAKRVYGNGTYEEVFNPSNYIYTPLIDDMDNINFLMQFCRNNKYCNLVGEIKDSMRGDKKKGIKPIFSINKNTGILTFKTLPPNFEHVLAVRDEDTIYLRAGEDITNSAIFEKAYTLGFGKQGYEYNGNESYNDMKSINNKDLKDKVRGFIKVLETSDEVIDDSEEDAPIDSNDAPTPSPESPKETLSIDEIMNSDEVSEIATNLGEKGDKILEQFVPGDNKLNVKIIEQLFTESSKQGKDVAEGFFSSEEFSSMKERINKLLKDNNICQN